MSDRMRGSVRTDARDGDGAAENAPEAAAPDGGAAAETGTGARTGKGATAVGKGGSAQAPSAAAPAPAEKAPQPAVPPPGIDGTQVITPASPPSGVFAGPAAASSATPSAASSSAPPVSPLVPPPGAPAAQPQPVGRTAGPRTTGAVPPPVGVDGTQAVPVVAAGNRPSVAPGRPGGDATTTAAAKGRVRTAARGPRRARLQLRHIDTWSALKISLIVSIALFFVWMVAVGILYGVLSGLGVFTTLNDLIGQLSTASGSQTASSGVITAKIILGGAAVIGAVNIVLLTALCTVSAFVYNLCSDLVGGLEVTLAERE